VQGVAAGWALDRDALDRALEIHFYLDGPAFAGGTFVGSTRTGMARPDVNGAFNLPGNVPASLQGAPGFWMASTAGLVLAGVALSAVMLRLMRRQHHGVSG